jgi:protein involved in polysaccharide export with SLBB domain
LKSLQFLVILFCLISTSNLAQSLPNNISIENISQLSDDELYQYYQQIKAQGYSIEQIKALAIARGISISKISEFEKRIQEIETKTNNSNAVTSNALEIDSQNSTVTVKKTLKSKSELFGLDFFSNDNISFTPNINLATPTNYILGPGDELVISIWGAAERTYNVSVDREGALRLSDIGPIFVNGMTIADATNNLKASFRKIYNGINAPDASPYKVFVGVSLSNVRSVQVNIIGEVEAPGTYAISSLSTVLNALYSAGGPTNKGTLRDIKLVRNGKLSSSFDMYQYLIKGSQDGNVTLQDQDVIIVSPYISRVSISGAVKRPGVFEMKPTETINDLLRYVSGFTSNAYKDRIVLERIQDDRRKVKEILLTEATSELLQDGDNISIKSIIDKFTNRVEITGAVYRPGAYELTKDLTLLGLLEKSAGLLDQAFLERGTITRSIDDISFEIIPFSVSDVINKVVSIDLVNNDAVKIYNKYSLEEEKFVSISGAINSPKKVTFLKNMTIEDLILIADGFKQGADATKIDVYRKIEDDNFETLTESFRVSVSTDLNQNGTSSFLLQPDDQVSVRFIKGYSEQIFVQVEGEANYPGTYTLENKTERISDVITKAGGLSPYAYIGGASLVRKNPYYKNKVQSATVGEVVDNISDKDVNINLNNLPNLTVGIDLVEILENPDSKHNLLLKNGDKIIVPDSRQTIKVDGQVLVPALIRYDKSYSLKDYVNKSGGFSNNAKKGKIYVVYLNGDIAATKRFLFFKSYPKLEPGALVIVPKKPERKSSTSVQQIVGASAGLATTALLIYTILQ